jgi:hypothetical protein
MLPTLDIQTDAQRFLDDFYPREEPVLFRNAARAPGSAEDICRLLNDRIAADDRKTERIMWYDVREQLLDEICGTPQVIADVMNPEIAYLRENCVRIWFNPRGHLSPWHYDGHSLHVFNLQLKGCKRWSIVSPDTPLACMPFNNTCLLNNYSMNGKRHFEFTLEEGDMIFLPRYWYHLVKSEGEMNVNVNWVLMPKAKPVDSKIARREAQMMWFKDTFYGIMPPKSRWLVDNYAGGGREAVRTLTRDVSPVAGFGRLAKELAMVPLFLLTSPLQLRKVMTLRRSKQVMRKMIAADKPPRREAA